MGLLDLQEDTVELIQSGVLDFKTTPAVLLVLILDLALSLALRSSSSRLTLGSFAGMVFSLTPHPRTNASVCLTERPRFMTAGLREPDLPG